MRSRRASQAAWKAASSSSRRLLGVGVEVGVVPARKAALAAVTTMTGSQRPCTMPRW